MRKLKAFVSYILVFALLLSLIPLNLIKAKAESDDSNMSVLSYQYNSTEKRKELKISWQGSEATVGVNITYQPEETTSASTPEKSINSVSFSKVYNDTNSSTCKFTAVFDVTGLKDDYLYDLEVRPYTSGSSSLYHIYFLPGMTFTSKRIDNYDPLTDGYESGTKPELNLSWNVPKVLTNNGWEYITKSTTIDYINKSKLFPTALKRFKFKINVASNAQDLDSTTAYKSVTIQPSETVTDEYDAIVDGSDIQKKVSNVNGVMSINLIGRKDKTENPDYSNNADLLYDSDLLPGTVYFMNIKPAFYTAADEPVNTFTLGDPSQNNGKLVTDKDSKLSYTYTPVRFKISRDASDNVYITAYRIHKEGSNINMPNLYYSIQATNMPNLPYGKDWEEKARMTDEFFPSNSSYAVTVITGVNPYIKVYYKVVVKTDSADDRLESLNMKYQMSLDNVKPPIPINVSVDMTQSSISTENVNYPNTSTVIKDADGNAINVKTTDILLTWDKPTNYDTLTNAEKAKLIYHIMINTNTENKKDTYPLNFPDEFPQELKNKSYLVNNRWVLAINALDKDIGVSEDGDKLTLRIDGSKLFRYIKDTDSSVSITNPSPDDYPYWFIENKIYYLTMFTTKCDTESVFTSEMSDLTGDGVIDISDFKAQAKKKSLVDEDVISQTSVLTSFTTLPGENKQVPVPTGFTATGDGVDTEATADTAANIGKNYATLKFDDTPVNTSTFPNVKKMSYELFMASGSNDDPEYFQIGSSDADDLKNLEVPEGFSKATMSRQNGVWSVKVPGLKQNTIYRFKLRVKLVLSSEILRSDFTSIVPVTTQKVDVASVDTTKLPMAPADFSIAIKDGNQVLNGTSVTLDWSILESDVTYQIVATSSRINDDADTDNSGDDFKKLNDSVYDTFESKFKLHQNGLNTKYQTDVFKVEDGKCDYNVLNFMTPNNIYFYSIRAQRVVNYTDETGSHTVVLSSKWVTIPVTSPMIETPSDLAAVQDFEIGMNWEYSGAAIDDFSIKIKKATDSAYSDSALTKTSIVKDGTKYYARITGLEAGTKYNVEVIKGDETIIPESTTGDDKGVFTTRDQYKNVEVKWTGTLGYTYDIAIRDESTGGYFTIKSADSRITWEKSKDLVGTQYFSFHAVIFKKPIALKDGSASNVSYDLTSNTKYFVKVRSSKTGSQSSNYAGPVTVRTSFSQSDYDSKDDLNDTKAKLVDKIDSLEKKPYYKLNYILTTTNTVLLKGDRLTEELNTSPYHELKIDLSDISSAGRVDIIYIPQILGDSLKSSGGSIDFVLDNADYKLVSSVLDENSYNEVSKLKDDYNEQEVWFKLTVSRPDGGTEGIDVSVEPVSQVNMVKMDSLAMSVKYSTLKQDFTNKVYNSETGLIKSKKDKLDDLYLTNKDSFNSQGDYLVDTLVDEVENELASYVKSSVEGGYNSSTNTTVSTKILGSKEINEFSAPVVLNLFVNGTGGFYQPYGLFVDNHEWRKMDVLNSADNRVSFELIKAGKYLIGTSKGFTSSIPKNHWAYQSIVDFNNKYNIADVFTAAGDFDPDAPMTLKEGILILDKIFIKDSVKGESIQKKVSKLELSTYFNSVSPVKDLSREQAATLFVQSYCLKNGVSINSVKPASVVVFNDAEDISSIHFNNAEYAVTQSFMACDANGMFNPAGYITRADFITSIQKALQ